MTTRANQIERYYDSHTPEGEELTQSIVHYAIIKYFIALLEEIFEQLRTGVISSVNLYMTNDANERPLSPDIAVIDGFLVDLEGTEDGPSSYHVGVNGPPPRLVVEFSSKDTWLVDLVDKPSQYEAMGVREYFVFDPNLRTLWKKQWRAKNRLVGWRSGLDGQYYELEKDETGRIWSEEMQSWLVVEGKHLRLYTQDGHRRLTGLEASAERSIWQQQEREAAERQARTAERQARIAEQRAEAERLQREAAEQRAQELAEKLAELLRQQGANPDELS